MGWLPPGPSISLGREDHGRRKAKPSGSHRDSLLTQGASGSRNSHTVSREGYPSFESDPMPSRKPILTLLGWAGPHLSQGEHGAGPEGNTPGQI